MSTRADFYITGSGDPSPTADGGFTAVAGETLTLQLEASPASDIQQMVYSLRRLTADCPAMTLSPASGIPATPTGEVTFDVPGSGVHSFIVRGQANGGMRTTTKGGKTVTTVVPEWTRERKVSIRTGAGIAKLVVGEQLEGDPVEGWVGEYNDFVESAVGTGDTAGAAASVATEVPTFADTTGKTLARGPLLHVAQGGNALVTPRIAGDALELVPGANGAGAGPPLRLDVGTGSSAATRGNVWVGFRSGEAPSAQLGAGGALLMKHVGTAPSGGTFAGERALYPKSDGWYESDGTTESKLAAGLTGAGAGTASSVLMVDATGNTLSRTGVTSDGAGSLTLGTDGAARPGILIHSSTVGRGIYLGTNEVTQIAPTVDTILGLTHGRANSSLTWTDHTKPVAGDFNELIWDPGLGELRNERYYELGNHVLDRMDRPWGSTTSYTTGLSQFAFAAGTVTWVNELQNATYMEMVNGHLSIGAAAPGDSALVITQVADSAGGSPNGISYTAGAHTNLNDGTIDVDVLFNLTRTKTWQTGAITNQSDVEVTAATYAFVGDSTVSKAYTTWFNGAPTAGAHATLSDKGAVRVTGDMLVEGTAKLDATNTGYAFQAFVSSTDGFRAVHNGTRSWGLDPMSGNDNVLSFGVGVIWSGLGGNVLPNLLMRAGYGADATYPCFNLENRNAAAVGLEQWGPAIIEKHRAWNTGGTPASEEWVWTSQKTSVQGNPSTAFLDVKAARAGGAAQNVLHLPGQTVTITGMTLPQLITQLTVNFPFYV